VAVLAATLAYSARRASRPDACAVPSPPGDDRLILTLFARASGAVEAI
jgi:hypothetical protein